MKRAMLGWLMLLLLLVGSFSGALAQTGENLITNGGFEVQSASGEPEDWYAKAYRNQAGYSRMGVTDEKAHSGQYSIVIDNANSNDARYLYTAHVEPQTMYRLSGYVLVEHMQDIGNGANFGIEDIYSFSDCVFDTEGDWKYLEWYGETGPKQTELTFGVRVGGYSAESVGKAYFDDIVLEKVEKLPKNVFASVWYKESEPVSHQTTEEPPQSEKRTGLFLLLAVLFAAFVYLLRKAVESAENAGTHLGFCVFLLFGLLLRVLFALKIPGYQVDIGCFTAWSMRMAEKGPWGFYAPDYFCDYPPGAMLLLWPIGWLLRAGGYQSSLELLIVKLLPILFDLLGAVCLYGFVRRRAQSLSASLISLFYLLNPAVLVNGAAWGQVDSMLAFFLLLTALFAMERKWRAAIPLFVTAVLVKPQALLFAPVGGMWLIWGLKKQNGQSVQNELKEIVIGAGAAIAIALMIVLPFSVAQEKPFGWLFALYGETLSSYSYATLNTANLYYLIGANWKPLDQLVPVWLPVSTACLLAFCSAGVFVPFFQKKTNSISMNKIAIAVVMALFSLIFLGFAFAGATFSLFGYSMMALVYLLVITRMFEERRPSALLFYMALALMGVYVLGVKVHERYLFPALLLLLAAYAHSGDRRVLWLFVGFSATTFVNTAIVLENSILFGSAQGHLNTDTLTLNRILCLINLALTAFGAWIGFTGLRKSEAFAWQDKESAFPKSYRKMLLEPSDPQMHFAFRDLAYVGAVTLIYAVIAFSHLGSTVAPQTAWVSTSPEEQIVLDLGAEEEFSLLYYGGVSYHPFSIAVSSDGENWSEEYPCQMREGMCWQWKYVLTSQTDSTGNTSYAGESAGGIQWLQGRYIRVNACEAGLNLWEIVARSRMGENLPMNVISHTGAKTDLLDQPKPAANLVDEMATCIGEPSWFNSMYFDEIYHAREAYHNLHGETTYEWTHPPLGKLLMALGIAIFGMTPFGWRFAGTLIGVLMLPALYLLALQLTKKRSVAVLSMVAFALDLMHFTQTRIATIDSFPLLFILLSYVYMIRYMQTDVFAVQQEEKPRICTIAFWRSLLPLFLSGLFMGLSIASKWTGVYSAVGLAFLFFLTIWRQYRASSLSFELDASNDQEVRFHEKRLTNVQSYTLQRILITCAFCVLFFVVVPLVIYVISYIPQLSPSGPFTLERVIRTQENMLSYHSTPGLGMDHPFQSPWWQWPFILKPIWYVQDRFEPAGYASTIMCLGNPWVFYIGAFAILGVLLAFVHQYVRIDRSGLTVKQGNGDMTLLVIVVAFFAQYLPWMLVPRSMYIYHYFASVPFIILSTAWLIDRIQKATLRKAVILLYLIGALAFFVMFFPYASGMLTKVEWLDAMKWFSHLYY